MHLIKFFRCLWEIIWKLKVLEDTIGLIHQTGIYQRMLSSLEFYLFLYQIFFNSDLHKYRAASQTVSKMNNSVMLVFKYDYTSLPLFCVLNMEMT